MYGKNLPGLGPAQAQHIHNAREEARLAGPRPSAPAPDDGLTPGLHALFLELASEAATADWGARWSSLSIEDIDAVAKGHPDAAIRERARCAGVKRRLRIRKEEEKARTKAAAEARRARR